MEEDDQKTPDKKGKDWGILFGAPAGVGKTAFAKAMAEQVFGDPSGYQGTEIVKASDKDGLTNAFNKAAKSKGLLIIEEFEKIDEPMLFRAVRENDLAMAEQALAAGEDINAQTLSNGTALHLAAQLGHKQMCGFLIDKGIDMHKEMAFSGYTPTHAAIAAGRDDIAVYLAMRGGKIEPPSGGLFGAPAGMKPPAPSLAGSPKDDKFSQDVLDRIRTKFSEEQVKRAKSVAAMRRKRGCKGGK